MAAGVALALGMAPAWGQGLEQSREIDLLQFKPFPGASDVLGVAAADGSEAGRWQVFLATHLAHRPLRLLEPETREPVASLVSHQWVLDLGGAWALYDRLEVGVVLPLVLHQGVGTGGVLEAPGLAAAGLGDLRLVAKGWLWRGEGWAVGAVLPLSLPTGSADRFAGHGGATLRPAAVGEVVVPAMHLRFLGNLGVALRGTETYLNLRQATALDYRLGLERPFRLAGERLAGVATLVGEWGLAGGGVASRPLELLAGLRWQGRDGLSITAGGGPGLTQGAGTPRFRAFLQVGFSPPPAPPPAADADGDGLLDGVDACPQSAEDLDGHRDDDGCPDLDDDGDGVADVEDACPRVSEDLDGFEDADGCPDLGDDGDGVADLADACPRQAEDLDGVLDADGCPERDGDRDGVEDTVDACPAEPEIINGVDDEDGCPDEGTPAVRLDAEKGQLVILEKVYFATARDVILPESFGVLQQVAATLKAHPEIVRIRVEGHTDDQGADAYNLELSQRRAESVVRFLREHGIDAGRLVAEGFGERRPIDDNGTETGRANNRRVDFMIVEVEE